MADFTPNTLVFDTAGCMTAIMKLCDAYMSHNSDILLNLYKLQIDKNGNGSSFMKSEAKKVVHEILHEVAADHITIQAGFDEAMARSMARDFYVRAMVVLHGNQAGGPLETKPGTATFRKHVIGPYTSNAKTIYPLPAGFNQGDVSDGIQDNVMKDIEKYFLVMCAQINHDLDGDFFGRFLIVR